MVVPDKTVPHKTVPERTEILSIDQLSSFLRVPKSTLYKLASEGRIPSHKVGRHWRFRGESVDRWPDRPGGQFRPCEGR
jgi:excisionase family DNA binding protein